MVRAPRTDTCWPMTARTAVSNGSTLPGTRSPGIRSTSGASVESRASAASIASGSASRSSSRRKRRTAGDRSRQSARRNSTRTCARPLFTTSVPSIVATPWPLGSANERTNRLPSDNSTPGIARWARNVITCWRLNGWRTARSTMTDPAAAVAARRRLTSRGIVSQLRRRCREHSLHGVVELADAAEPGSEGDRRERHRRRLDEYPSGRRPLCSGDGQRPGAELIGDHPIEVTLAVVQSSGESGDAVPIDHSVADQAHRPGDDVATDVPFRRPRRGVGTTSFAGPVAMFVGRRSGREELDVGALRRDRRAARTAVDAGGPHGPDEVAVEARVATRDGPVALLVVQHHVTMMATADPDH